MEKYEMNSYDKFIEFFKKLLLVGIGISILAVGLVSLFFPFSPGLFMIFLGLTFSAKGSESIAKARVVKKTLKFLGHKVRDMKDKAKKVVKKIK